MELGPDGQTYAGGARDNYSNTQFARCVYSPQEIRCQGVWSYDQKPSELRVTSLFDGSLQAHLTGPFGAVTEFECVARADDVGNDCLYNPFTPTCHVAPWQQR